jgi:hypothetical protein
VPAGTKVLPVEIPVECGVTVEGSIVNADGTVPALAAMTYRCMGANYTDVLRQNNVWPLYNGKFKIRGVPADGELLVYFLDAAGKQGKMLTVKGSDAEHPLKVTLEKCGSATVRFIDINGNGVAGFMPTNPNQFALQFAPASILDGSTSTDDLLITHGIELSAFDRRDYGELMSDEDGRITLPTLIPSAIYKMTFAELGPNKKFPREIKVQAGEKLELPDVIIDKANVVSKAAER